MRTVTAILLLLFLNITASAGERWRMDFSGAPSFVFVDDRVELPVSVIVQYVPEPKDITDSGGPRKKPPLPPAKDLKLGFFVGSGKKPVAVKKVVCNYKTPASSSFVIDCSKIAHGTEMHVRCKEPALVSRLVFLKASEPFKDVTVRENYFVNTEGRRVIFMISRHDESAGRRWAPVRQLSDFKEDKLESVVVVGNSYGGGEYAKLLYDILSLKQPGIGTYFQESAADTLAPAFELFLAAASVRDQQAETVIIFPGIDDIRLGTPTEEYAMALKAAASLFDTRVILCSPPPWLTDPTRRDTYSDIAREVTRERQLEFCDLSDIPLPSSGLVEKYPGSEGHKEIAVALSKAVFVPFLTKAILLLPIIIFLCASLALFWLFARARHR